MKRVVTLILLLNSSLAFSQDDQENKQVIYQFMRQYFKNKKEVVLQRETYKCLSCLTQEDGYAVVEQLKSIISEQELAYLMQQHEQMAPFIWNADSLKSLTLISNQTIKQVLGDRMNYKKWKRFKRQYGKSLYTINKPLLTQDKQTLVVYIENECGDDCGWGNLAIFRKENGEWKEVGKLSSWIK